MAKSGLRPVLAGLALCGLIASFAADAGSTSSPADSPFIIESWGVRDGLPQSSVIAVIQARDGYLWLGTLEGLVRFDGVRFTVFDENNTPGLKSSRIVYLFEDSQTNLWVGTETTGVALVHEGKVRPLEQAGGGSREGRLVAACEDTQGAVWLYTADGQLIRHLAGQMNLWNQRMGWISEGRALAIEKDRLWIGSESQLTAVGPLATIQPPQLPRELVLPVNRLDLLLTSAKGGYWRLANGRIQKCQGNTLEHDFGPYPWKANARPSVACEDAEGNLVVGTLDETSGDGVFWFDAYGKATRISRSQGLSHDGVLSLCVDREGDLWVGTDGGGLNRVRRRRFHLLPATKNWVVQSVCADASGAMWIGANGGQVAHCQPGVFEVFTTGAGVMQVPVRSVFADTRGQVWLGTWGRGLLTFADRRFADVVPPVPRVVFAIHEDRRGTLWLGTQNGLLRQETNTWKLFGKSEGLTSEVVRAIADDADGNLWIGTEGGGLNRLRDGRFTAFRKEEGSLPSDRVTALLVDTANVLWVGTAGGLARFDGKRWQRVTTSEGLLSNSIGYLLDDGEGDLWLGSNAGLMRVKKQSVEALGGDKTAGGTSTVACRAYVEADGLPTRECTFGSQPAACRTADGQLWFPTTLGLVGLTPGELKPNPVAPPVVIESVWMEGQLATASGLRAPRPSAFVVPPRKGRLEIHYTSLNLAAPDRARFQYRLSPAEPDWTDAGSRRVAPYQRLAPGHHVFEVRACNEDGVWSERPATLTLTVQPPFWRTWWFMTATTAALLGAVAGTVHLISTQQLKRQLRQQEALEKERSRIARDLHDQLGANLTQVSLLAELVEADKDLPEEVETHARQITHTSRETTRALDEIVWATNPANDTLEGLITYVCKYAQDYLALANVRYRLEVPSQLPPTPLLPEVRHNVFLAAKEAVNNVVKHAHAKAAWVRLRMDNAQFTLEIQDDGRGLPVDATASTRNGLKNMRKRLEEVGGAFVIEAAPEGGTIVRLTVPLRTLDYGLRISR